MRPRPRTLNSSGASPGTTREGDVGAQLLFEALADLAAGDVFAFAAGKGAVVDAEGHVQRGLVDADGLEGFRASRRRRGVADIDRLKADDGADVAGGDGVDLLAAEAFERVELDDALARGAVVAEDHDGLALVDGAGEDLADADTADVVGLVEGGDEHLERRLRANGRRRDVLDDGVEDGGEIDGRAIEVLGGPALLGGGENDGEIESLVVGAELDQQVEDLVYDLVGRASGRSTLLTTTMG